MTVRSVIRGMNALVRERNTFQKSLAPLDNLGVVFFPQKKRILSALTERPVMQIAKRESISYLPCKNRWSYMVYPFPIKILTQCI